MGAPLRSARSVPNAVWAPGL